MSRFSVNALALLLFAGIFSSSLVAADWPQWRGPYRDDVSREKGLLKSWPSGGPKVVWTTQKAGLGLGGIAVVGDVLYTLSAFDGDPHVVALDAGSGKQIWKTPHGGYYENRTWGGGPRSTPTVTSNAIYAISGRGQVIGLARKNGKKVWSVEMTSDLGGKVPKWGYTESPLVDGGSVICTPGGSKGTMAALDAETGRVLWRSGGVTDGAAYSSVIAIDHEGRRQYVQLTEETVFGVDARSGKVLWQADWPGSTAVIPTPIFDEGHVYISSGYGVGCNLFKIDGGQAVGQYEGKALKVMKNHHGGVLKLGDHLYGYSDNVGWVCQDFKTGEMVWRSKELGKGAVTYADDRLYCVDERRGEVVLAAASPEGWKEHGRFTLTPQAADRHQRQMIWVHPVVANGRLYLRDQEVIVCYDVTE